MKPMSRTSPRHLATFSHLETMTSTTTTARLAADYTHCVYNTDITVPAGSLCHVLPCDGGEVYRFRPVTEYEILEEWDYEISIMPEDAEDPEFVAPVFIAQEAN
jgi:hypothetical protein